MKQAAAFFEARNQREVRIEIASEDYWWLTSA
jgi:hypothetical protein